ncbi:MAG: ParA family protein [Microbacterium sp.]|uniref:ParA family protein n=1 Tax=Microbacterium sp. TaxID=51671 RepID=UPI001D3FDCF3|nr:ParA family protein [Microbacterium sp.]MBW8764538.1 ParA family protein [Microbacterium sp.]
MGINRVVTVGQGKGGVGKTSLTGNVGAMLAADLVESGSSGRVLLVDMDHQGNLARELGYQPDSGDEFVRSMIADSPLPVIRDVRPQLDVVPGGPSLGDLSAFFGARTQRGGGSLDDVFIHQLGEVAGEYELILIDTPPGDRIVVEAAMAASAAVIIPTRSDDASLDGVERVAERFMAVRDRNPDLQLAGVVLFAIGSRSRRLERDVRATLQKVLGDAAPVFDTWIRSLETAAVDARRRGLLVHELEQAAGADKAQRIAKLRAKEEITDALYSRDPSGLADDYSKLTREILQRVVQLEQVEV